MKERKKELCFKIQCIHHLWYCMIPQQINLLHCILWNNYYIHYSYKTVVNVGTSATVLYSEGFCWITYGTVVTRFRDVGGRVGNFKIVESKI